MSLYRWLDRRDFESRSQCRYVPNVCACYFQDEGLNRCSCVVFNSEGPFGCMLWSNGDWTYGKGEARRGERIWTALTMRWKRWSTVRLALRQRRIWNSRTCSSVGEEIWTVVHVALWRRTGGSEEERMARPSQFVYNRTYLYHDTFSPKYSQNILQSSHVRARYGVSFVSS